MSSENSKTFDPQRILLNLSDKINLKRTRKYVGINFWFYHTITEHSQRKTRHLSSILTYFDIYYLLNQKAIL